MGRAALILLPALTLLAMAGLQPADARSKSFCRDWAQDVADRTSNGEDGEADASMGVPGGASLGETAEGRNGAGRDALAGDGGAVLTGVSTNDRWQHIFRRAYAECRAS